MNKLKLELEVEDEETGKIIDSILIPKDLKKVIKELEPLMEYM